MNRDAPTLHGLAAPMPLSKLRNYDSARGAEAYKADYRKKLHRRWSDLRERALLHRWFTRIGAVDTILDLPCGHGRLSGLLARHCRTLVECDWSSAMLELNRRDHGGDARHYVRASALEIPLHDGAVDVAVSFRLSHHLDSMELRERHLRELFRVARRHVVVTWFSASSVKNLLREVRVRLGTKRPKNVLRNAHVRKIARDRGFAVNALQPLFVIGSGHAVGWFSRSSRDGAPAR